MKKTLFLSALLLATISISAQGRRAKQSFINAEYGFSPSKGDLKSGTMAKLGYGKVFGESGLLGKAEVFYNDYEVSYIDNQILPYQKYGLNISAGYSYEGLYPVMLNAFGGIYGAYENANNGKQEDPLYNATISKKVNGFVYGLTGTAEAEIFLSRKFTFALNYTQYYDLKSAFSKSNYGIFGGFKYYFN